MQQKATKTIALLSVTDRQYGRLQGGLLTDIYPILISSGKRKKKESLKIHVKPFGMHLTLRLAAKRKTTKRKKKPSEGLD